MAKPVLISGVTGQHVPQTGDIIVCIDPRYNRLHMAQRDARIAKAGYKVFNNHE